ncbi:MAG: DNA-3-methyladenine glycosylase [Chlorobium sp.]|jgi:DNA-3-methyladenine glycosylase|uniref:DNA-3-methyladenine glycosylase n=1 Tax=Chlorobium sp. TaxID=1095 RepID=UPI001D34818C|nr:DNA-3-methyladenine glycosylase [Chlorobium sp.]MBN1278801.1 DNA-3-methyladenine glycosylase [Chlorobiaceae bacterium]MCF8216081.1 DNA-3-methyladenine glycosylase [Chlorobium sp.]MCF8270982.1 DNA-3-methyladenine glycosylase [Chlorobium sp.]MCF8287372.1 DNA-3-methyladenine glycosylase [Chlorobium sp.]MCF8290895.1 DNA-3-methyladenine glycosylase [Chlorobium sp.]
MTRLEKSFFEHPTLDLAGMLLGKIFVRRMQNGIELRGKIVETEAYLGYGDEACHAWRRKTERNSIMFAEPGHLYVYFTYGNHHMLNIVSEPENIAGAVLIRAMEPLAGESFMREQRKTDLFVNLMSGPGKLTRALAIDRSCNGRSLFEQEFQLQDAPELPEKAIGTSTRVGITRSRNLLWRKFIIGNPHVSRIRVSC